MASPKRTANKPKPGVLWHHHGVRIVHHKHSGRLLPWHYTTYAVLYFLLLVTAFLVLFASRSVQSQQTAQGDITLSGTVPGTPPPNPATITSPTDGQHFNTRLITVSGDCTAGLFVELHRNGNFAGMDLCDSGGRFQIGLNLVPGSNSLVAKIKDSLGQYGPDSNTVTVFYDVPNTSTESPGGPVVSDGGPRSRGPFLLYTDNAVLTAASENDFTLTYEIDGGKAPYAVAIDWGDGTPPDVASHLGNGDFTAKHIYAKGGQFTISISGSDSDATKALIQTIVIAQATSDSKPLISSDCTLLKNCVTPGQHLLDLINRYIWPATIAALLMTLSFWLGERFVYSEWRRSQIGRA